MSYRHDIRKTLNLEDKNINFKENALSEEKIHGVICKVYEATLTAKPAHCVHCGVMNKSTQDLIKHGNKTSMLKLLPVSGSPCYLRLRKQRYDCKHCKKTFTQQTSVVQKNCHISNNVKFKIALELKYNISQKDCARQHDVSAHTVGRILENAYEAYKPLHNWLPKSLCFDAFKSVKSSKGKMSFIFCDAQTSRIIDIVEDRRVDRLIHYFLKFKRKARRRVREIVIDMYSPYMKLIKICFPNAKIIIDRFHIVQLFNRALNKTRIETMKHDKQNYTKYKRFWRLFLQPINKVDQTHSRYQASYKTYKTDRNILDDLLIKDTILSKSYEVYQTILYAIKHNDKKLIDRLIEKMPSQISEHMQKSIKTLKKYRAYIENTLTSSLSNGRIEGLNNKIKSIKRVAFGFRSFYHFRNRILIQQNILKLKTV